MKHIYKITIVGVAVAAGLSFAAARIFADGEDVVIEQGITKIDGFSAKTIRDASISDEGASYSGEAWLESDGTVRHPKWFEGDKRILADDTYYLIRAETAPSYYEEGGEFADMIDIGDTVSEQANAFEFVNATEPEYREIGGRTYTYRELKKNGAMAVNLKCDPEKINYLTVRLWGGDAGDTILWLCDPISGNMNETNTHQPHRNDGVIDRRDWVELNYSASTPQYDGGFIYATYEIPQIYTKGKKSVSLRLYSTGGPANYNSVKIKDQTENSRGIYDVYMTQTARFVPSDFGFVDGEGSMAAESLYSISNSDEMASQKDALKNAVIAGIDILRKWQIYGEDVPSYVNGMMTRSDWRRGIPETDEGWKKFYPQMMTQNLTPLNMLELAAFTYNHADELELNSDTKEEMRLRIIAGIDFLCRAQGSNGGFYGTDWIGGPERRNAESHNLTGFGLRAAGKALTDIFGSLDEDILSKPIDSNADGVADMSRREAWTAMLIAGRDYLITLEGSYGHAPNQDMANSIAALRFDTALELLGGETLGKRKAGPIFDRCFGLSKNLVTSSYWVSPKGTILENFGSLQGSYSGDYGSEAIVEMSQLAEIAYDRYKYTYRQSMKDVYAVIDNYYFTGKKLINGEFVPQLYTEGIISNRNVYYPGTERYAIDIYSALSLNNDTALKIIADYLEHKDIASLFSQGRELDTSNAHYEDNILDAAYMYLNFDEITEAAEARNISGYKFKFEDENVTEFAWADEMARNVIIKDGDSRIYMALNWRNPVYSGAVYNTPYSKDEQRIKANNLCRVHETNSFYDSYGYAAMTTEGYEDWTDIKSTDGYMQSLMTVHYGNYSVIMNSTADASYAAAQFEADAELNRALSYKELISGDIYSYSDGYWHSGGKNMQCAANSTLVLKAITLSASKPLISDRKAYTLVKNNTSQVERITLYAADYTESGELGKVYKKTVTAEPGMTRIEIDAPNADSAFVWDDKMKAIAES